MNIASIMVDMKRKAKTFDFTTKRSGCGRWNFCGSHSGGSGRGGGQHNLPKFI